VNATGRTLSWIPGGKAVWCAVDEIAPMATHTEISGACAYHPLDRVFPAATDEERAVRHAYACRDYAGAVALCERLIDDPRYAGSIMYALGVCLFQLGRHKQALSFLKRQKATDARVLHIPEICEDAERFLARLAVPAAAGKPRVVMFTSPKPFKGDDALRQHNAIESWRRCAQDMTVVLCDNGESVAEYARAHGLAYVNGLKTNPSNIPLIDDMFTRVQKEYPADVYVYINADIIVLPSLIETLLKVCAQCDRFLMIGQRWDFESKGEISFHSVCWQDVLRADAMAQGTIHAASGIDYFAFTPGLWGETIPPMAIGRAAWDNWLVEAAGMRGAKVVDATEDVFIAHQNHDYAHIKGSQKHMFTGEEIEHNHRLAGSCKWKGYIYHAPWEIVRGELRGRAPYPGPANDELPAQKKAAFLLDAGMRYFQEKSFVLALSRLDELIKFYTREIAILYVVARCLLEIGAKKRARDILREIAANGGYRDAAALLAVLDDEEARYASPQAQMFLYDVRSPCDGSELDHDEDVFFRASKSYHVGSRHTFYNHTAVATRKPSLYDALWLAEPVNVIPQNYDRARTAYFPLVFTWNRKVAAGLDNPHMVPVPIDRGNAQVYASLWQDKTPWDERTREILFVGNLKPVRHESDLYSLRVFLADWFYRNTDFAVSWYSQMPLDRPYYKGVLGDKIARIAQSRFMVCSENSFDEYFTFDYMTDKIYDAFFGQAVPVYMGAANIDEYIPSALFVDLRKYVRRGSQGLDVDTDGLVGELHRFTAEDYTRQRAGVKDWFAAHKTVLLDDRSWGETMRRVMLAHKALTLGFSVIATAAEQDRARAVLATQTYAHHELIVVPEGLSPAQRWSHIMRESRCSLLVRFDTAAFADPQVLANAERAIAADPFCEIYDLRGDGARIVREAAEPAFSFAAMRIAGNGLRVVAKKLCVQYGVPAEGDGGFEAFVMRFAAPSAADAQRAQRFAEGGKTRILQSMFAECVQSDPSLGYLLTFFEDYV
jgi:tetratricopeptide (TPR) repeat protein